MRLSDLDFRYDIFARFPWLKNLFMGRWLHLLVRIFGDGAFTFIIVSGLFGPQDPKANIALFIAWGVWWPSVVVSWFLVGKMWCGFCPFPGLGRILRRLGLGLNLDAPAWLRRRGTLLSVLGLAAILWLEGAAGITRSPRETALLMLAILAGATLSGLLFKHKAWCMHLCPMGRLIGQAAAISMVDFRPDHVRCRQCRTFDCKRGRDGLEGCPINLGAFNVRSSTSCHMCGHCLRLCPHDSPSLWLRNPFAEMMRGKGSHLACAWVIPVLAGSQLLRFLEANLHPVQSVCPGAGACTLLVYAGLFALGVFYVAGMVRLGDAAFGLGEDPILGKLSLTLTVVFPLVITGELVYRLTRFLDWLPDVPAILGRQFGFQARPWGLDWLEAVFPLLQAGLLALGFMAGTYVLRRMAVDEFPDVITSARLKVLIAVNSLLLAAYVAVLYPGWLD